MLVRPRRPALCLLRRSAPWVGSFRRVILHRKRPREFDERTLRGRMRNHLRHLAVAAAQMLFDLGVPASELGSADGWPSFVGAAVPWTVRPVGSRCTALVSSTVFRTHLPMARRRGLSIWHGLASKRTDYGNSLVVAVGGGRKRCQRESAASR